MLFKKRKSKKKRKVTLMITIMIIFTFGITIGYSILSSTISAGGSATAELATTNTKLDNSLILAGGSTYVELVLAHYYLNTPTESINVDNDELTQSFTSWKAHPSNYDMQTRIIYTNYDDVTLTSGTVTTTHNCNSYLNSYSSTLNNTTLYYNDSGTINVYLNFNSKWMTSCTITTTLEYDQGSTTRSLRYYINNIL